MINDGGVQRDSRRSRTQKVARRQRSTEGQQEEKDGKGRKTTEEYRGAAGPGRRKETDEKAVRAVLVGVKKKKMNNSIHNQKRRT